MNTNAHCSSLVNKLRYMDLTVCILVNEEKFLTRDVTLTLTMPNVEIARAIFTYDNMFKFQVDWNIIFEVIVYTGDTKTDMNTL